MEWEFIAPMVISIVLFVTIGGVLVLRPIAKRLGDLIELYAQDRLAESGVHSEVRQIRDLLETMSARLELIEERQDFTERLIGPGEKAEEPRASD